MTHWVVCHSRQCKQLSMHTLVILPYLPMHIVLLQLLCFKGDPCCSYFLFSRPATMHEIFTMWLTLPAAVTSNHWGNPFKGAIAIYLSGDSTARFQVCTHMYTQVTIVTRRHNNMTTELYLWLSVLYLMSCMTVTMAHTHAHSSSNMDPLKQSMVC